VGDVRALLEAARAEIDDFEHNATHDPFHRSEEEAALFEGLRASWGARYYEQVAALHEMSKSLDEHASALGRAYASAALLPLLSSCQMHRRAYEKPLGYAGDFRMMELYFAHELSGDSMFGRFLHSISQNYTLGKTVVARESVMRDAVRATLDLESSVPARVLALAAGPALELRRLLDGTPPQRRPAQLILLDQDEAAHETAYRHLSRILLERPKGALPLTVECLHFSVRQLLKPQTPEEQHVVDDTLSNLDLAYSAGLYDYLPEPVAARLTQLLYDRLRPGGRLLLGNLMEARDTTWIMEYVLGWHLLYRTDEQMLRLAKALRPTPLRATVTRDPTGHCLFLDVTRPS
jgi:SAM-dependent methyltransferase